MPRTKFVWSPTPSAQATGTLQQCIICLDTRDLREHETVSCGHTFHKLCIRRWLGSADSCPICRKPVKRVHGQLLRNRLQPSPGRDLQHQLMREQAPSHQVQQGQIFGQTEMPREQSTIPPIPPRASEEQQVYRSGYVLRLQVGTRAQEPQISNVQLTEHHVTSVQLPLARPDREQELSLVEQLQLHRQVVEEMLQESQEQNQEKRQLQEEQLKLRVDQYDFQVERELFQEEQRRLREEQRKLHEEQLKLQEDRQLFQEERNKFQEERKFLDEQSKDYPIRTMRAPGRVKKLPSRAT